MNLDYMSQFMGPGLGGIMAGTEQRQMEDKRAADTQNTLQQILASQGQEQERAALLPGKLAQESDRAAMAPLARQEAEGRLRAVSAKEKADEMNGFIDAQIKMGDMPGGQESIMQDPRFTKFQGHPISKRAQEILLQSKTDPEGAKKAWEEMKEKISTTAATIEKRQQEEAAAKRAAATAAAAQTRVETQEAGRTQRLIMSNQAKAELEETKAAAKAAGVNLTQDKYLVQLQQRLSEAELKQDVEEMGRIKSQLTQAKGIMMEIATAVNTEKGQNATARARALGITVPDYIPRAPTTTPTTPPATTTPAATTPRAAPSGRGATVGPIPGPTSQAPATQGPGPVAQVLDGAAAAILPSAQAAQGGFSGGGYDWGSGQDIRAGGAPAPQGGMVQPVNMQVPPAYRQPSNVNFGATDIPKQGGRTQILMDEVKNTQMKIASLNQRLQVAQRNGDREYIAMLAEDLDREQKNLPLIMREMESLRGK